MFQPQTCLLIIITVGLTSGCGTPAPGVKPAAKSKAQQKGKSTQKERDHGKENPATKSQENPQQSSDGRDNSPRGDTMGTTPGNHAQAKAADPSPVQQPVQQIVRPRDSRPKYDDDLLARFGIKKTVTDRLILYSDLPVEEVRNLPELANEIYPQLEAYFGPLPPDPNRQAYQMTAFYMGEPSRFLDAGVLSEGRVQPHEGWSRGNEFWWNRQPSEYYTRHLLLHEATHCFMHVMPAVDCPPWYVEGMAEWFGTHHRDQSGQLLTGILPASPADYPGWERISVIQQEVAEGRLLDIDQILSLTFNDFQKLPAYSWSWALCHFLNAHPRYQQPFRELGKRMMSGGFVEQATELFAPHLPELQDEWLLFASQLQYGHDISSSVIEFEPGEEIPSGMPRQSKPVAANRGWQSSRCEVVAGRSYEIQATGRVTLATTTRPWISEPQGISIRYFAGQPLGRLLACVRSQPPTGAMKPDRREILKLIPLDSKSTFVAPRSGTLYFRVNDAWNELADNSGEYQVRIEVK